VPRHADEVADDGTNTLRSWKVQRLLERIVAVTNVGIAHACSLF
jgi:hypothetical protein